MYLQRVFVDPGIQHAVRMRRIILSRVAPLAVQYFSTHDFQKSKSLIIKHIFWFSLQLLSEAFFHFEDD
jgi:hypothetical protein